MSSKLWQCFLEDDVESFKRFLAGATYSNSRGTGGGGLNPSSTALKVGSPGASLASSPGPALRGRRNLGTLSSSPLHDKQHHHTPPNPNSAIILTRADVNAKDRYGRTLLHLAASSQRDSAYDFAAALLEIPFIDIYSQDSESGWTALHRALYAGNAAISHALMARDISDSLNFNKFGGPHHPSGGLITIKDKEGNSPFDVFGATILPRDINQDSHGLDTESDDDTASNSSSVPLDADQYTAKTSVKPQVSLDGDEVFTFGSNKNLNLGLGDEGDRQFPERVLLKRPTHLLHRFNRERQVARVARNGLDGENGKRDDEFENNDNNTTELPIMIKSRPIVYQDIFMSKLHTGIITNDPESNLFMCGFGPGGRLGTGDEATRFNFVCIESGGLAGKRVVALALGQDHSIAISEQGEVFTWGSNKYGQLGYSLPKTSRKDDVPIQTTPRQIFNPFKKDVIVGAAASSIHSVVFTHTGLYTFGKNEGQLGLIDADARSLESLTVPRKVGASLFSSPIAMVSAIDRATTCLLENHEVWVFTHYGYSKLMFPLDGTSSFIRDSFLSTRYGSVTNHISKITTGGNTISALSSFGEVYSVDVTQRADTSSTAASTTNPAKIRNSLPQPARVWSVKKPHMAARDVDVGQDGSIIICTESGSAWRKEKRAKLKDNAAAQKKAGEQRIIKDYKFVRIPGLSRVVAVRSNAFGAYAVVQRGCDVAKEQIVVDDPTIWRDLLPLLAFREPFAWRDEGTLVRDYQDGTLCLNRHEGFHSLSHLDIESKVRNLSEEKHGLYGERSGSGSIVWLSNTTSDVRIPVHEFVISGRSSVLRYGLSEFRKSYYFSLPDLLSIEYDKNGDIQIHFTDIDFLSVFNLALYIYTDQIYDVWNLVRRNPKSATYYRQIRTEVIKISTQLDLRGLEKAARMMVSPVRSLHLDMERAFQDPTFFESSDVVIELDNTEVEAHSQVLYQRCPFFEGLFHGRAAGRWLSSRRELASESNVIHVDLKHIDPNVFGFVLRHMYADTDDDELFEDVRADNLDDFVDLVIDVMAVANELMIDRLALICQKLLGKFGMFYTHQERLLCPFINVNPSSKSAQCVPSLKCSCALLGNSF